METIEYKGKEYPVREIDLSYILEGYKTEMVADYELSKAMQEVVGDFEIEDSETTETDNLIYCYMNSGFIASNPTDVEILLEIVRMEGIELTDMQWYNLMAMATSEFSQMYRDCKINLDMESYVSGGRYNVYIHKPDELNRTIYYGESAQTAAISAISALSVIHANLTL